jgi:hypothetical protein
VDARLRNSRTRTGHLLPNAFADWLAHQGHGRATRTVVPPQNQDPA